MYKLVIEDDEGKTKLVPFIREEMTIGRKEGNTIRLTERNVSRRHARLTKVDGAIELEDFSRYGTKRNGEKIKEKVTLREGDAILIGDYRITLRSENQSVVVPARTPEGEGVLSPDKAARLVVVSSNFAGREFPLVKTEMVIGRTEGDIRVDHRSISRNHAKIVRDGERYKILDLKSANGVKVNGEAYRSVQLRRADIIELGHVRLRFVPPGDPFVFIRTDPEEFDSAAPASNKKLLVVASIAAIIFLGIIAAAFVSLTGETDKPPTKPAANATEPDPEANEPEVDVDALIKEGDDLVAKEEWAKASEAYAKAIKAAPGNAEVEDKRSKAIREIPFKKLYVEGKAFVEQEKYEDAIDKFSEIPEGMSIYSKKIEDEGLLKLAMDKASASDKAGSAERFADRAQKAAQAQNWAQAARYARLALQNDPNNATATAVLRQATKKLIEERKDNPAVAKKDPPKKDDTKKDPPKKETPAADKGGAKELLKEARTASLQGNQDKAISLAKQAMSKGGAGGAYRILALAYEKKGDKANAVKYYNILLKSNCSSRTAEMMRQRIIRLGGNPGC